MIVQFYADGFEEAEALVPLDLMRRAGLEVTAVSINPTPVVTGAHGIVFTADTTADRLDFTCTPRAVILPGGMPGTTNLGKCALVKEMLLRAYRAESVVAAICAAPSVLGGLGLLRGRHATCFPGFEKQLEGAVCENKQVVTDGNVITGRAMGAAYEFGLTLVKELVSEEAAAKVASSAFIETDRPASTGIAHV